MSTTKKDKNYVSELDEFLSGMRAKLTPSKSQLAEVACYQKIAKKRDVATTEATDGKETLWQDF